MRKGGTKRWREKEKQREKDEYEGLGSSFQRSLFVEVINFVEVCSAEYIVSTLCCMHEDSPIYARKVKRNLAEVLNEADNFPNFR